jgi:hypothetical protein
MNRLMNRLRAVPKRGTNLFMSMTKRRGWVVIPEHGAVHVHLDQPIEVIDSYDVVDRADEFLPNADVLILEGRGWSTPRTWKTARVLRERASSYGVETIIDSPTLMIDEHT